MRLPLWFDSRGLDHQTLRSDTVMSNALFLVVAVLVSVISVLITWNVLNSPFKTAPKNQQPFKNQQAPKSDEVNIGDYYWSSVWNCKCLVTDIIENKSDPDRTAIIFKMYTSDGERIDTVTKSYLSYELTKMSEPVDTQGNVAKEISEL